MSFIPTLSHPSFETYLVSPISEDEIGNRFAPIQYLGIELGVLRLNDAKVGHLVVVTERLPMANGSRVQVWPAVRKVWDDIDDDDPTVVHLDDRSYIEELTSRTYADIREDILSYTDRFHQPERRLVASLMERRFGLPHKTNSIRRYIQSRRVSRRHNRNVTRTKRVRN